MPAAPFTHRDHERTIVFGRGTLERAVGLLPDPYVLLTTERNLTVAGAVRDAAQDVVLVAPGRVDEVAGDLRDEVRGEHLVALGGGRVVDVAKALAAADPPRDVSAIPTTLSAAEMTGVHRPARGADNGRFARVRLVLNDPDLSASAPPELLAASGGNALAHASAALDGRGGPLAAAVAERAVGELGSEEPDSMALGALLAGWAVDVTGLTAHHLLCQTLVREGGLAHAAANVAVLPHSLAPLVSAAAARRALATARALHRRAGVGGLREQGLDDAALDRIAGVAAERARGSVPEGALRAVLAAAA